MQRKNRLRLPLPLLAVPVLAGLCREAKAEPASEAEVLFRQGREALNAGQTDVACEKFERSHELEPTVGALLNLGHCLELDHKVASAAARFDDAIELARKHRDEERLGLARKEAERLNAMSPRLSIVVPNRTADSLIELNGERLTEDRLGDPMRLDPGTYEVRVSRPGQAQRSYSVVLSEGSDGRPAKWVEVVVWSERLPAQSSGDPPLELDEPAREATPRPGAEARVELGGSEPLPPVSGTWTWVGAGMLAAGTTSIVGATWYGVSAMAAADDADCDAQARCSPDGLAARSRAREQLAVSYAVGIAGGAVALGGLVLILTGPDSTGQSSSSVGVSLGPSSVQLFGAF